MRGRVIANRFEVSEVLKTDHDITTVLGFDRQGESGVVVKTASLAVVTTGARLRLEHDVAALSTLASPSLAPPLCAGCDEDIFYIARPFLTGATLEQRLAEGGLAVDHAVRVACDVLRGLAKAHDEHVLHGDVKPSNVVVSDTNRPIAATITDFGLIRAAASPVTARYASPERAGLLHRDVDARSDVYSVGILLYEAIAGHPPFQGQDIGDVLRQHLTVRPRELRSLGLERRVPRVLDEVLQRILRKDPRDRYQSAQSALADLEAISDALARGDGEPAWVVGARDQRQDLTEPAFIGREAELAALRGALERTTRGDGGLVLVEAESGSGKTRLLSELAQQALAQGAWVLHGRGIDQEARHPYQILRGVVAEVAERSRADADVVGRLRERTAAHQGALSAALPELGALLGSKAPGLGVEARAEAQSAALSTLLDALGAEERPALLLLDDCQWADNLSLELLAYWHQRGAISAPGSRHVLVVAAFRAEDGVRESRFAGVSPLLRVTLAPFGLDATSKLVESMAGAIPAEVVEVVQRLSEGSPLVAVAALQGLVESGALVAGPRGWHLEASALARTQSSAAATEILSRRLDRLSTGCQELLGVAAVLGKHFELGSLAAVAGDHGALTFDCLDEARRHHVIWSDARGTGFAFVHDRVREAALHRLTSEERSALHARAAAHIEGEDRGRVFDLAYHLDEAGLSARALPYALAAADQARAQHALELAEHWYRRAERHAAKGRDRQTERRIAEGLGVVLLLRGSLDESLDRLQRALELAPDPVARAQIEGKLGELLFKRGDVRAANQSVQQALASLGRRVPSSLFVVVVLAVWETVVQIAHTWLPRIFARRATPDGANADLLAIRLLNRLAYSRFFGGRAIWSYWAHLRGMNLVERYRTPTPQLGQAYANHAIAMSVLGYYRRGIRYAEKAVAVRKILGDVRGQGQALHFYGILLYAASRFGDALSTLRESARLLAQAGDRWEANDAGVRSALCLYRLGDLREAVAEAKEAYERGRDLGDTHASAEALEVWSKASAGCVPSDVLRAELARSTDDMQRLESLLQAEGVRLLYAGRYADAAQVLSRAIALVQDGEAHADENVAPAPLWLAQALRLEAQHATIVARGRRDRLLARAEHALRRGLARARRFGNNQPHALREVALLAAARGHPRRAARALDRSLRLAERLGMRQEHALTLLARGELGLELGRSDAGRDVANSQRQLRSMGHTLVRDAEAASQQPTLSLADRFGAILRAGRKIASSLSEQAVIEAVEDAALSLLRGDNCRVYDVDALDGLGQRTRKLVESAIMAGRPALAGSEAPGAELRSGIAAPILVRGRVAACLCVTHSSAAAVFAEEEERLADFLATLAGAALENAAGFAQVEALSRSLEQRVEERTKELATANDDLGRSLAQLNEAQDQLVQTAKMAAVGTLVAGLSHELNNPIGVILGFAQSLLKRTPTDAPAHMALSSIEREALRCAGLVRALLDFSRRTPRKGERISPDRLLERVLELAAPSARRKGVRIELERSAEPLADVEVAPTEIESALLNIAVNAIDATPANGAVRLCSRPQAQADAPGIELRVSDTGSGIPEEILSRIFEPFFTTKEVGRGTGLGLSLARQTVEGHGGQIRVESQLGQGTTFRVWLPLPRSDSSA